MQHCYADFATRSTADLTPVLRSHPATWEINRIKVGGLGQTEHYGKGVGRELLRRVIADADAERVVLRLAINSYGPLSTMELVRWYERNDFVLQKDGYYVRLPKDAPADFLPMFQDGTPNYGLCPLCGGTTIWHSRMCTTCGGTGQS